MIQPDRLKDLLHKEGLTRAQQILLCLAVAPLKAQSAGEVRATAVAGGLRVAKDWNVSSLLGDLKGMAVRSASGWELNQNGRKEAAKLAGIDVIAPALSTLRSHVAKIASAHVRAFVEEAIGCTENRYFRAAVVLTWVGALAVLYDHVVASHLVAFNAEARRRDPKWKDAKTTDDLAKLKEYEFLQILEAVSILGKSVKTELEACLKFRNGCGHPNSLTIAEHRVNSHIETLIDNVFSKY